MEERNTSDSKIFSVNFIYSDTHSYTVKVSSETLEEIKEIIKNPNQRFLLINNGFINLNNVSGIVWIDDEGTNEQ